MATSPNSLLAAILSLIIPGLGQLYKGHILMGIIWFLIIGGGYFSSFYFSHGLFGGLIGAILHIVCIIQAYKI